MAKRKKISLAIDGNAISVEQGTTIMEAAERLGIRIPRLCYHPDLSLAGSCRVCVVEVKDMGFYMTACSVQVWEGMEVQTNSPDIRQARRDIVELLLDNHPMDCQTCERDGNCELQNLAYAMGVRARHFEGRRKRFPLDLSSHSVVRDSEKCVLCGRCVRVCAEIQGVCNLSQHGRGFHTVVAPAHLANMDDSVCIQCGQCINVCPTAAFLEKRPPAPSGRPWPTRKSTWSCRPPRRSARPSARVSDLPPGTPAAGKMVTALRRLGFDAVFDTDFGADLTIVEEAHELLTRLEGRPAADDHLLFAGLDQLPGKVLSRADPARLDLPLADDACSRPWSRPTMPRGCGLDPEKIFMVAVMPCVAKKYEARRPEHLPRRRHALDRRRADHAGADLDDQVLWHRLPHAPRRRVRRPAGHRQRRGRHLRHDRRRDGSHAPRRRPSW